MCICLWYDDYYSLQCRFILTVKETDRPVYALPVLLAYGAALLWDLDVFIEKMKGVYVTIEETILELGKSQAE